MTPSQYSAGIARLKEILGFKIPLDGMMMVVLGQPVIDIVKLDQRLMRDYNYSGSMIEFIEKKYGAEAAQLLDINIQGV